MSTDFDLNSGHRANTRLVLGVLLLGCLRAHFRLHLFYCDVLDGVVFHLLLRFRVDIFAGRGESFPDFVRSELLDDDARLGVTRGV